MPKIPPVMERVRAYAREQHLWSSGDRLLVACSGGGDSVALLLLLHEMATVEELKLTVAHLNHGLRGEEADGDAQFVSDLSQQLGLPLEMGKLDVAGWAHEHKVNLYEAGRILRRDFLRQTAEKIGATGIALGHTRDDRAETVLINLLRGAGLAGLSAMRSRQGIFIRPLLLIRREELREYLKTSDQLWREDSANVEGGLRARLRNQVIPILSKVAEVDAVEVLARVAENLSADEDLLKDLTRTYTEKSSHADGIPIAELGKLPQGMARRVVLAVFGELMEHGVFSRERWEEIWFWLKAGAKGRLQIPGGKSFISENGVLKLLDEGDFHSPGLPSYQLTVPGTLIIPEVGWRFIACSPREVPEGAEAIFGVEPIPDHLLVRSRLAGDNILLTSGTKKIQDLFVDAKVSRYRRDQIPLFIIEGKVVWVPGFAVAQGYQNRTTATWAVYRDKL